MKYKAPALGYLADNYSLQVKRGNTWDWKKQNIALELKLMPIA